MNRFARALPALLAATMAAAAAHAAQAADDEGTPLSKVQLSDLKNTFKGLPADAPRPVWYSFSRGAGMGCGLLPRGGKTITPLVEPEDQGAWPTCLGFSDATSFDWRGKPVFVYRFIQRDTREDTYTYDSFVRVGQDGIEGVDGLSSADQPPKLTMARAASWGKATLAAVEAAKSGFVASKRDAVLTDHAYLAVGRNASSATCSASVDLVAAGGTLAPVTMPCKAVLATTSVSTAKADWLVLMIQGVDGHPAARVFEAGIAGVREATDVEAKLAPTVAGGKILAVKAELKRLLGN